LALIGGLRWSETVMVDRRGNWSAVASFVCGLASLAFFWLAPVIGLGALFAIVFGVVGRREARQGAPHGPLASVGLVLGWVAVGVIIVLIWVATVTDDGGV
jgi:hypothetical protein